jgi:hypothetical protein
MPFSFPKRVRHQVIEGRVEMLTNMGYDGNGAVLALTLSVVALLSGIAYVAYCSIAY